jgi:hypothetical protein
VVTTIAINFLIGCAQAHDRLLIAGALTRLAWRSSPRRDAAVAVSGLGSIP